MANGIRWQVWAGVLGVLGGLGFLTYLVLQKPKSPPPEASKRRVVQRSSSSPGGWSRSGFRRGTSGRSAAQSRSPGRKPRAAQAPIAARRSDAGPSPDGAPPEADPEKPRKKLKQPAWIRGRVVALPGRKPISSFTITYARVSSNFWFGGSKSQSQQLRFPKDAEPRSRSFSHPKGHFDLHVEKGRYLLQVKASGYQDGNPTPARSSTRGWYRGTFALVSEGRSALKGKITGRGGKPLQGAMVAALLSGGSRWGWRILRMGRMAPSSARMATSNAEGEFQLKQLPAGKYGVIIRAPGHVSWSQRGLLLADGEHKDLGVIALDGGTGTLKGTVYGPDGQGKSGVFVVAVGSTKRGRSVKYARTGASGEYQLADVPAGKLRLYARMGRGMLAARRMHSLTLKAGETKTQDFRFGQGGLKLTGTVFGPDSAPIIGAKVSAFARIKTPSPTVSSGTATTDAQGQYRIEGLQKGLHTLTVEIKGSPSPGGTVDIQQGEQNHDIRLKGGTLELSFFDKNTKKPLKVPVWSVLSWNTNKNGRLVLKADPGKSALFKNLPDVEFGLRVYCPGYSTLLKSGLRASPAGQAPRKLQIDLMPAGKVSLTLNTPDKKQPARIYAMLMIEGTYKWVPSQASPNGELLVRMLPPGPAQLKIMATGYKPLEVRVDVPGKGTGKGTFELTPAPAKPSTPAPKK